MNKRIVICADGTWNRPEKDLKVDFPTNVLRLSRAISPIAADGKPQQVFMIGAWVPITIKPLAVRQGAVYIKTSWMGIAI